MDILLKIAGDAIKLLKAVRAEYSIKLPTGEEFTSAAFQAPLGKEKAEKAEARPKKGQGKRIKKFYQRHPEGTWGEMSQHIRGHLDGLEVGNVAVIPLLNGYGKEEMRKTVSAWAVQKWGAGSARTAINDTAVKILRVS